MGKVREGELDRGEVRIELDVKRSGRTANDASEAAHDIKRVFVTAY